MRVVEFPVIPGSRGKIELPLKYSIYGYDLLIDKLNIEIGLDRPYSNFHCKELLVENKQYYIVYDDVQSPFLVDANYKATELNGLKRSNLFNSLYLDGQFIYYEVTPRVRNPNYLLSFKNINQEPTKKIEFSCSFRKVENRSLFTRDNFPLVISSLNSNLDLNWKREFSDKSNAGSAKRNLILYKDQIITNLGYTDNGQLADGHVIALNKQTGETCWLASFEHPIYSCTVIGDSVYLTGEEKWYVLSADDGSIQLKGDASEHLDNIEMYTTLSSDGRFLYFSSVYAHAIAIYDRESGEYINKLEAPEGFNFSFDHPTIIDGFLYFELGSTRSAHIGNVYGLLITTTEEIAQGGPFNIEADVYDCIESTAKDDEQGQYYEIDISSEDVGKILHYGRITAHKLIGENTYSNTSLSDSNHQKGVNELFNGRVDILIPKTSETERYTDKFDLICEKIKEYMKDCITPYDERELNITWSWK